MPWGGKDNGHGQGPWARPPAGGSGGGGGSKPPSQGPDFDAMMRKGRQTFRQMFSGGNAGGDSARLALLLAAAAFGLWLASGIYFVKADEEGIVQRFGAFHRISQPGIGYHLPYPLETVQTPKVTAINRAEIGYRSGYARGGRSEGVPEESLMLTGDENIVDINFEVQWRISDAAAYLFNVRNPEETVKTVAESSMREVIGKTPIATALAEGKLQVEQATKKLIQDTLSSYQAGIEVVAVNLLKVDPPAQVIDAFRDVQTARADLETARNQADAYRNDILPRARGDAQKMILDAEAYRQEVVARAQGEASRFAAVYAAYKQSKDVTRRRMYLEAMEDILQGVHKVLLDRAGGVVPYLPLPELKPRPEEKKP